MEPIFPLCACPVPNESLPWHVYLLPCDVVQYIATGLWAAYFILTTTLYFPPPRHVLNDELTTSEKLRSVDWIGYFLLAAGLSLFLVGTTQGGSIGWKEAKTLGPLISGILVSFAFCLYEWKGTSTGE